MGDIIVTVQLLYYTLKAGLSGSLRRCRFCTSMSPSSFFFMSLPYPNSSIRLETEKRGQQLIYLCLKIEKSAPNLL